MKKEDLRCILKVFGTISLASPLVFMAAFFLYNNSILHSILITLTIYFIVFIIDIAMWNYLGYGKFTLWINHKK